MKEERKERKKQKGKYQKGGTATSHVADIKLEKGEGRMAKRVSSGLRPRRGDEGPLSK